MSANEAFRQAMEQAKAGNKAEACRLDKVPDDAQSGTKHSFNFIYDMPACAVADTFTANLIECYGARYSLAVTCFQDDPEVCLASLHCPAAHHGPIRPTNLIEGAVLKGGGEPIFLPLLQRAQLSQAGLCHLRQASQCWCGVRTSLVECQQLDCPFYIRENELDMRHVSVLTPLFVHFVGQEA